MLRKIIIAVVTLLALATAGFFAWFGLVLPRDMPVPEVQVAGTPEAIERGRYLAHHVAVCMDCHSTRDWRFFSGPIRPGTLGRGGERFDAQSGFPGIVISKNITPAALGDWRDGEVLRAMAGGISRDGHALFPLMPYDAYRFMDEGDAHAIVAYLRTLAPIDNAVPRHQLDFPLNFIVNVMPKTPDFRPVDRDDRMAYGRYLATLGGCIWCHTPVDAQQAIIEEKTLAGGHAFPMRDGMLYSANISPDPDTGIGRWSEADFIARFKAHASDEAQARPSGDDGFNTLMSWTQYAGMSEADLGAIYTFLMAARPVNHAVEIWVPAP